MATKTQAEAQRGRPADPSIEDRVSRAAIEVYSEVGWGGFTIDAVASRAQVGKAALYRRWTSKQDLLTSAMRTIYRNQPGIRDTGDVVTDLEQMAEGLIVNLHSARGIAELRLQIEAKIYPEILDPAMDPIRADWMQDARECIARAVTRGQLPVGTSAGLLFDAIRGPIINRFLLTPSDKASRLMDDRREFSRRVVRLALKAAES
ncbi:MULTISPECIES: TetR/AcrR family transcriptional regulator [unclassified Arthrobacter]|uniref:TetR/AcrR family transcriptional regulator n=1 Tax=unclassified Arthrobacter TaxID=235627 RepID=UPI0009A5987D|nr:MULTISPECIES: TetR/AcrR family transcriptional regulator [unclassified Arthrobacter]PNH79699.1 TetR family transcriptional regulator [Arthrobacter sp. AFG20]SLK15263.1 transcriptional regulator, TetR family [Arthrobacter sp. P2b]